MTATEPTTTPHVGMSLHFSAGHCGNTMLRILRARMPQNASWMRCPRKLQLTADLERGVWSRSTHL